ncbi:MAG: Uma2 family endonuclease [Fischerella sp.]|jgi:Uma2 family endonuclease|uniref:Uma2 family endonuclease n=1 Tax=unclassified Fischerella TaxID=494603 RepID=UPI00047CE8C6|nr:MULTISPECIES: Uma2 family endonuclease [unclassified Fischerella]NWF61468.1 Uma2 family endonuclease [Fischerella sp.]
MIQAISKSLTFEEFLELYPEDGGRYELFEGEIVEVRPVGQHEVICSFIAAELTLEIRRLQLPYFTSRNTLVKPDKPGTADLPDLVVLDKQTIGIDPYWEKYSTISIGSSAQLVVEVVSTNWRDDYLKKLDDYETLGIPEYWIVDYLALGAARYIGSPKMPTISVYRLVDGEYEVNQFRGAERVVSKAFPELVLTAEQVFQG